MNKTSAYIVNGHAFQPAERQRIRDARIYVCSLCGLQAKIYTRYGGSVQLKLEEDKHPPCEGPKTVKPNPPTTILLGEAARLYETRSAPIHVIYRDKLAERLGVAPKERLTLTLVEDGRNMAVSALVDGGDLTASQLPIFRAFLEETGLFKGVGPIIPERPITS